MIKTIPILIFMILLSACAGPSSGTDESVPEGTPVGDSTSACSIPSDWTIQLERSGGIAGISESMTLDSGGRFTVQSDRPFTDVEETLSREQVNTISGLLAQACPFEMNPNDAGCADCFLYKINVQMNGETYVMLATDVTLTEELYPLVDTLNQLMQTAVQ